MAALARALRTDAAIEMVGTRTWFAGRATCLRYLAHVLGSPGDWVMSPTVANGQPAAAAYLRDKDGGHHAFGLAVLTVTRSGIARITVFGGPDLVAKCGLPSVHPEPLASSLRCHNAKRSPELSVRMMSAESSSPG